MNSCMAHVEPHSQVPSVPHLSSEQPCCLCLANDCNAGGPVDLWRYYCGFQGARAWADGSTGADQPQRIC